MKSNKGFTLIEILAAVALMAVLFTIIYNVMVGGAFLQKRSKDEMAIQNSSKALLNHIGEIIMEQNTPVVWNINGIEYDDENMRGVEYEISSSGSRIIFRDMKSLLMKSDGIVSFDGRDYSDIDSIKVTPTNNSLKVIIKGKSDKANVEFSGTFYTRNT